MKILSGKETREHFELANVSAVKTIFLYLNRYGQNSTFRAKPFEGSYKLLFSKRQILFISFESIGIERSSVFVGEKYLPSYLQICMSDILQLENIFFSSIYARKF